MVLITRRNRIRTLRRGVTLIEVMVAATILAVGVMGVMGLYAASQNIAMEAEDSTVTYNISKQAVESLRASGFANTPTGASTTYYDIGGNLVAVPPAEGFQVLTTVTSPSDEVSSTTTRPARDSQRLVSIVITKLPGGAVVLQSATFLVYGGV